MRRVTGSHHGWNTELARNNSRVTGAATAVGHDSGSAGHDRLPVRISHVCDQDVALVQLRHLTVIAKDLRNPRADSRPDASALTEGNPAFIEPVALNHPSRFAAADGFGPGLQYVKTTTVPVTPPFDVHGTLVMRFDGEGVSSECLQIIITQRETLLVG